MKFVFIASLGLFSTAQAAQMSVEASHKARKNPIRTVVTMLQSMKAKVEEDGEKQEELFKKYMCYCKTSTGDLEKSVAAAEEKVPAVTAAIEEGKAQKTQMDADIVKHKADREAAESAMAEATSLREKEAKAFAADKADSEANIAAITKAVAALEQGMGAAFLQTDAANSLKSVIADVDMEDSDREEVLAFLSATGDSEYSPQSGEITGILKQMGDSMAKDLAESITAEADAIKNYDALMAAKKKETEALTASIEEKTARSGELAVELVNMQEDLDDTEASLAEDKAFLADLDKNCATKEQEWDGIVKVRAEEVLAISETIKILNDDDALELFKKTLPSPATSFVQVQVSSSSVRARALAAVHEAQKSAKSPKLDLIAVALHGKAMGFEKVLVMIDDMVALLQEEQKSDDSKKEYCAAEFDKSDDEKKSLDRSISESETAIEDAKEALASLTSDIEALVAGIKALDESVAEATENRKEENAAYKEMMASDGAAKEVLEFAKNRLQKFYNPKLHKAAPKRELSEEDRVAVAMGGTAPPTPAPGGIAGTGIEAFAQISEHVQIQDGEAPPPAPEAPGTYSKKGEESTGVMAMIDMLVKDLDKEMTTGEVDEKSAQADYEKMLADSKDKRKTDSKAIAEKEAAKADTEEALQNHEQEKASTTKELMGVLETIQALHNECDWLVQNFDVRKEARANEVESLTKAKAVLSGADYSLLQSKTRHTRSLRGVH